MKKLKLKKSVLGILSDNQMKTVNAGKGESAACGQECKTATDTLNTTSLDPRSAPVTACLGNTN
ncbi:hypothetical protein BKI52_27910 [marine bacterium AO1-C]|nr:hypothetical protein BKI52_27910 [marine bacterium AO1-C]